MGSDAPPPLPPSPKAGTVPPALASYAAHASAPVVGSSRPRRWPIILMVLLGASPFVLAILAVILLPAFTRANEAAERASCANNMTEISLVLTEHIDPQTGEYPPLAPDQESFIFGGTALGDFDMSLLECPSVVWYVDDTDEYTLEDSDYLYLGYAVRSQRDMDAYMNAWIAHGGDVNAFMAGEIEGPTGPIERLRHDFPNSDTIPLLLNGGLLIHHMAETSSISMGMWSLWSMTISFP